MKYQYVSYAVKGFASDDDCSTWVLYPTEQVNLCWQKWLAQHPDKRDVLEAARQLILLVRFKKDRPLYTTFGRFGRTLKPLVKGQRLAFDTFSPIPNPVINSSKGILTQNSAWN